MRNQVLLLPGIAVAPSGLGYPGGCDPRLANLTLGLTLTLLRSSSSFKPLKRLCLFIANLLHLAKARCE